MKQDIYDHSQESLQHHLDTWLPQTRNSYKTKIIQELVGDPNWQGTILDVGCGIGHFHKICQLPNAKYVGIEINQEFINKGKQLYPKIDIRQGNIYNLQFEDKSYDLVLCNALLIHLNDIEKAIKELTRVCKKYLEILIVSGDPLHHKSIQKTGTKIEKYNNKELTYTYRILEPQTIIQHINRPGITKIHDPGGLLRSIIITHKFTD